MSAESDALTAIRTFLATMATARQTYDNARSTALATLKGDVMCADMLAKGLPPEQMESVLIQRVQG